MTVDAIEAYGFEVAERIEMALASDSPEAVAKSVGVGVTGFAQSYANDRPDLLLVLGDRYEMLAAVGSSKRPRTPVQGADFAGPAGGTHCAFGPVPQIWRR